MAEDTKKVARLDFDIEKALSGLDKIDTKLKTISESSEKYAKKIGQSLGSGIDKKNIDNDIKVVERSYDGLTKYEKNRAADVAAYRQKQEIKTTETLKREHAKQEKSVQTLYDKISNYAGTYLIYQGFNVLKRSIGEVIDEMVNLESSMVQIDRVLNESSLDIDNYRDKLMQTAYDYGNSMDNVADIALRLAQAGYDSNEVLALTEKTLLALNTAELNATQATDDMVAVMAQWGLMTGSASEQARNYGEIIDKINKVADNFPTTSQDIMDALKKTSSAFNLAGASIDETIALITAAEVASQRGGKVIGTALSNITQQLKDEKRLNIAESLGLNFFTDEKKTQFKGIVDIFAEMSQKMQQLKDAGKENSTEMQELLSIFTVFRRNIGSSLLGQMSGEDNTYLQVLNDSLSATGYSLQENAKYMATAKAAQEQFNVSVLQLKTEVWDKGVEDVYRNMLSFGTDVVKNITDLIDKFGVLPAAVGTATLAFTALNKDLRGFNFNSKTSSIELAGFFKKIKEGTASVDNTKLALKRLEDGTMAVTNVSKSGIRVFAESAASTTAYASKLVLATAKTIALEVATVALNAAISMGISLAITALVTAIDNWIHAEEKAVEKNKQLKQEAEDAANELNQQVGSIQELTKEYKNFSDSIKKNKDKNKLIDTENVNKAYELQTKINDAIKDSGKQVQLVTETTNEYGEKVKTVNTQYEDQLSLLRTIAFEKKQEEARELKAAMELAKANVVGVDTKGKTVGWTDSYSEQLRRAGVDRSFGGRNQAHRDSGFSGEGRQVQSDYFEFLNTLAPEEQLKTLEEWNQKLEEAASKGEKVGDVSKYVKEKLAELQGQYKTLKEATDKYSNSLSELYALSGQVDVFDTMLTSIGESYSNIEGPNKLIDDIQAINEKFREGKINTKEYFDNLQRQIDNIDFSASGEELEAYQAIFAATTETMAEGLEQLISGLETGAINFADYSSGVKEAAENTLDLYVKQNGLENIDGVWMKGKEAVDEYANSLQGALNGMNEMASLMPVIAENYDYIAQHANEAGEAAFKQSDTTTKAYQTLANNVAVSLNKMKNDNNQAYQAITNAVFTSMGKNANEIKNADEYITKALNGNANALNAALNESANQLAANTNRVTSSLGNVFSALGNAISGFNYKITATPRITGGFGLSTDENGIPNGIKLPSFGFDITGQGGGSIQGLGSALKTFGSDLRDYSSSKFKYTTLKSAVGNYSSSGSPNLGSSGGYSGGKSSGGGSSGKSSGGGSSKKGSSSKTSSKKEDEYKKRLEYFTSTLEKMEDKEEEWVKKQKELGTISNNDMIYITQQRIKKYEEYLKKIKKATWMNKEDRKKLEEEYTKKLKDLQLDYFDYLKGKLDDEIKAVEDAKNKKIKALEEETDKKIALLKKERESEKDADKRKELLEDISYWEQRTGIEAVQKLAEAKAKLAEFDRDAQINAQIEALEAREKAQKESLERQAQNQIDTLQQEYDAKVKAFSESNKIIYDDSVIASKELYNAYKKNFIDPLKEELKNINKKNINYTVKKGDTLKSIAKKYNTTVKKIKAANKDNKNIQKGKVKKGQKIKIPTFHSGGIFSGTEEGLALLKKGEWVLRPEWSNSLNRMMKYFDNVTQGKVNGISNNSTIEVSGNLVNIQATVRNQSDIDAIGQKVEKILKDKFNIKK